MESRDLAFYHKRLIPKLPNKIFRPYRNDLFLFLGAYMGITGLIYLNLIYSLPWYLTLISGIGIGTLAGMLSHITHNILHGTVVESRQLQTFLAFWGFLPHWLSPTFYRYWHNYLHHTFTQKHITDPDAYPSKFLYENSIFFRQMYKALPGSRHPFSYIYFFHSFTSHSQINQFIQRFKLKKQYKKLNGKLVNIELILQALILFPIVFMLAKTNFLFLVILPFAICNYMIMSYIATNHALRPLTKNNDPLANTLSVKACKISNFLCRNMGFHVCHHLFPHVNPRYYPEIHKELIHQFALEYKCIPKFEAIKLLYKTPRIYNNERTVAHPGSAGSEVDLETLF